MQIYYCEDFIHKLARFIDSNMNKSMQGAQINIFIQKDKVNAFMKS
jgi:hypothetical protein